MRYVYLHPDGKTREEFHEPCENMKAALIDKGYEFLGHKATMNSELISAERGRKARITQAGALDSLIARRLHSVDEKSLLSSWGIQ